MIRILAFLASVIAFANAPIEEWTCPDCDTTQESGRGRCMNGCGVDGPLAPQREGS